jgi:hypothetical protein
VPNHEASRRIDFFVAHLFSNHQGENAMKKNVGGIDRTARIVAGSIILSLFFILDDDLRWWALLGVVPLMTGLIGWCPAYLPFGIRTCAVRRD